MDFKLVESEDKTQQWIRKVLLISHQLQDLVLHRQLYLKNYSKG
jgi:hypothetical protein